ncbi:hypothetical protein [Devosia sp. Root635]|uniref:hypothetical protein n=1 Tax=Devosia sp. Root635 TaxID=1736575 RepID=UPI0006F93A1D|nr:hypothetical protein [Devosia sp. Root635]KRA43222.1 hypothetical protein ASD80_08200 [Devosia sp. Root635]
MAIGVFATQGDAESVVLGLAALGITRFERLPTSTDQAAADPRGTIVLRVYLQTLDEEQLVARTLLESNAQSVQLHDVVTRDDAADSIK